MSLPPEDEPHTREEGTGDAQGEPARTPAAPSPPPDEAPAPEVQE